MKFSEYNYEAIDKLDEYINNKYKGALLREEKSLNLDNFIQNNFSYSDKNCSLVAITRLIKYYSNIYPNLKSDNIDIFNEVYTIALEYGFDMIVGTHPTKIDNILKDYFEKQNIKVKSKGHYFGNFYNPLKREIDLNRPLIMNIAFGDYNNHSISVTGYKIYNYKNMNIKFIEVYDGWKKTHSYIDYNIFCHSIGSINVFSFNTLKILKK